MSRDPLPWDDPDRMVADFRRMMREIGESGPGYGTQPDRWEAVCAPGRKPIVELHCIFMTEHVIRVRESPIVEGDTVILVNLDQLTSPVLPPSDRDRRNDELLTEIRRNFEWRHPPVINPGGFSEDPSN